MKYITTKYSKSIYHLHSDPYNQFTLCNMGIIPSDKRHNKRPFRKRVCKKCEKRLPDYFLEVL